MNTWKHIVWECAYMIDNEFWGFDVADAGCESLRLCPICSIPQTPIFTIKGLCESGLIQLHYPSILSNNSVNLHH